MLRIPVESVRRTLTAFGFRKGEEKQLPAGGGASRWILNREEELNWKSGGDVP